MTGSASSLMAILFGLAVFAVIVAVGWRSVQNRRILRLQGADGQETIIVAREDDDISSIATSSETRGAVPAPAAATQDAGVADSAQAAQMDAELAGRDRLNRVRSSTQ